MKVFCSKCKYFRTTFYGTGETCCAPQNWVDDYKSSASRALQKPKWLNASNDCAYYEQQWTLGSWISRWIMRRKGKE